MPGSKDAGLVAAMADDVPSYAEVEVEIRTRDLTVSVPLDDVRVSGGKLVMYATAKGLELAHPSRRLDKRERAYVIPPRRVTTPWRNGQVQQVIDAFVRYGRTTHSAMRESTQYVIDFCEDNGIPYAVRCVPGSGAEVVRLGDDGAWPKEGADAGSTD